MGKLIFAGMLVVALGFSGAQAQTVKPAEIVDMTQPTYPTEALGIEGNVVLRYGIDAEGHVTDLKVSESTPVGLFDAAALEAVGKWSYRPRTVDGKPVDQPGNAIRLRFKPAPGQASPTLTEPIHPDYPRKSFDDKLEGSVTFSFDVSERGAVENATVKESSPPGVFDAAARKALESASFNAAMVDGKPQASTNLQTTVHFLLANAEFAPEPVDNAPPSYPERARLEGLNGTCVLRYTVASDGTVEKVDLVYAVPADRFADTCVRAIARWTFKPPSQDPSGRVKRVNLIRLSFRLTGSNSYYKTEYSLKPGQWVKLQYTLGVDGKPKDIKVIEKSEPSIDGDSCIDQLQKTRFPPYVQNGVATEKPNEVAKIVGPSAEEYRNR